MAFLRNFSNVGKYILVGSSDAPMTKRQAINLMLFAVSLLATGAFSVGIQAWLLYGGCFASEPCRLSLMPPEAATVVVLLLAASVCVIAMQSVARVLWRIVLVLLTAGLLWGFLTISFHPIFAFVGFGLSAIIALAAGLTLVINFAVMLPGFASWFQKHRPHVEELLDLQLKISNIGIAVSGAVVVFVSLLKADVTCGLHACDIIRSIPADDLLPYGMPVVWLFVGSYALNFARGFSRLLVVVPTASR
ncbi:hypothetical protein ACFSM5_07795 [Lacibacterium aquatile]|uniref:Disulfide bond formation protein B n=1 Tax=Lacibacterium aquatile TaxID=1168082 RepID=A0ABW5DP29_9PROT